MSVVRPGTRTFCGDGGVLLKTVVSMQNEIWVDMNGKGVYVVVITSADGRYVKKLVLD